MTRNEYSNKVIYTNQKASKSCRPLLNMIALTLLLCSSFWLVVDFLKSASKLETTPSAKMLRDVAARNWNKEALKQHLTIRKAVFPLDDEQIPFHIMVPFGKTTGFELGRAIASLTGQLDEIKPESKIRKLDQDMEPNSTYENKMIWLLKDGPISSDDVAAQALLREICGDEFLNVEDGGLSVRFNLYQNTAFACVQSDRIKARGPAFTKFLGFRSIIEASFSNDDDVIMIVDGDDYLSSPHALDAIATVYKQKKCLCSWGSMRGQWSEQGGPLKRHMDSHGNFVPRRAKWTFSHPRTLQVRVAKHLSEVDFQDEQGQFVWKGTDRGFIFRMLELSGPERACYIEKKVYQYVTDGTPKSNKNVSRRRRQALLEHFASLSPSKPIPVLE